MIAIHRLHRMLKIGYLLIQLYIISILYQQCQLIQYTQQMCIMIVHRVYLVVTAHLIEFHQNNKSFIKFDKLFKCFTEQCWNVHICYQRLHYCVKLMDAYPQIQFKLIITFKKEYQDTSDLECSNEILNLQKITCNSSLSLLFSLLRNKNTSLLEKQNYNV